MREIVLKVVDCPQDPNEMVVYDSMPGITGISDTNLYCGRCRALLAKSVDLPVYLGTLKGTKIIKCPKCGACNALPY